MRLVESLLNRLGIAGELLRFFLAAQVVVAFPHDLDAVISGRSDDLCPEFCRCTVYLYPILGVTL